MEEVMPVDIDNKANWAKYFENHKKIWCAGNIHWSVKLLIRLLELHRSDAKGWSLSVRKIAFYLGIAQNTVLSAIKSAKEDGFIEVSDNGQRKRRKMRLSASLRAPVYDGSNNYDELFYETKQPVIPADTVSVSPTKAINNKGNTKLNIKKSEIKEEEQKPTATTTGSGYRKFFEAGQQLFSPGRKNIAQPHK